MHLDLRHFEPVEFRGWFDKVSPRLLVVLDVFRARWGRPVTVSRAQGAIGRRLGPDAESQHNYDRWGEVRAIDIIPQGMTHADGAMFAVSLARECGATGIGVYPHWSPAPGLHIDVRQDRRVGHPALWAGVKRGGEQVYVAISEGYDAFGTVA